VQALVSESVSVLRASLPSEVKIVLGDIPDTARVSGEYAQLQQVLLNLCNNASQAMSEIGTIEINADVLDSAQTRSLSHGDLASGRYVRIAINDSGHGMDEATLARIFEP